MTTMISEVYEAFIDGGVSPEKAKKAAESIAKYDSDIAELKSGQRLLQWMVGFNLAFTMAMLWKIFS